MALGGGKQGRRLTYSEMTRRRRAVEKLCPLFNRKRDDINRRNRRRRMTKIVAEEIKGEVISRGEVKVCAVKK